MHALQDPPSALTPAQLKAGLWADARLRVHAVVMGQRVPDLPTRLAAADGLLHECLLPGALEPARRRQAPHLVTLGPDAPLTDWLLFEAAAGLGDWGLLVLAEAPRLALRQHLRQLLKARLPQGPVIDLDWMDPAVLDCLLPALDPAGCRAFFGPVRSFVVPAATEWRHYEAPLGTLRITRQACMR
ncbi:DUF4123 domain-containing protein [Aquariibacter albus]|uniref:DUF4123 domain-containing protein n=1 Tax=Aquariibacter albus TaxID=2759899 RepID=A0A839HKT0_9BURK|nr:DUF4123 domain-containing protein [Aquariibacter albus]MBB1163165.1 DUF4123 domain-containing protein [Aquariibacter albus]